jgi:hypothetical protein
VKFSVHYGMSDFGQQMQCDGCLQSSWEALGYISNVLIVQQKRWTFPKLEKGGNYSIQQALPTQCTKPCQ